ncbi:MAG: cellulase family glycosylhydrolase [Myxococcales bacterium]|nr:cellulase family glycosylhydrolase [Myxococcales bacterium]
MNGSRRVALTWLALIASACSAPNAPPRDVVLPDSTIYTDSEPQEGGDAARFSMPACARAAGPFAPLSTRCQHFVDAQGRVVVLRGVSARVEGVFDVTFDDGRAPLQPIPAFEMDDAVRMRQLGFNFLRLPINWSGVEPRMTTPPSYDDAYLSRVRAVVDIARRAGLLVLIDFHQDAYSKEIGEDGAPAWAIKVDGWMPLAGPLSADELARRRTSSQVLRAFETFFGTTPDGTFLRSRFAAMAAEVARRFRSEDAVIGYEIFNEPIATDDQCLALATQVGAAIREVDARKLLVFQPPAARNLVDRAMLARQPFPLAGAAYAPHVYTLALTGSESARRTFTIETLRPSHANAALEAASWGVPTLVTEWGYDSNGIRMEDYVAAQGDLQDEYGASSAMWLWKERSQSSWGLFSYDTTSGRWTERAAFRRALARVYPEAIAGWPKTWSFDRRMARFELVYEGSAQVTAPNVLYIPSADDYMATFAVSCDGRAVQAQRDSMTGRVEVPCAGPGEHRVVVGPAR